MDARDLALSSGPGQYKKTEASQANQFIWAPGYAALVDNLHQPNYG